MKTLVSVRQQVVRMHEQLEAATGKKDREALELLSLTKHGKKHDKCKYTICIKIKGIDR